MNATRLLLHLSYMLTVRRARSLPRQTCCTFALSVLFTVFLFPQPLQNRLMIATSPDGLSFSKLGVVLYNFADVPDAVVSPTNQVFVYFQGIVGSYSDVIIAGISPDGISNWSFQPITIAGTEFWPVRPCDPDVVVKEGIFRLYFTGDPTGDKIPETYSAISTDGIHFTLENGIRFSGSDRSVLDPSLLWIGDTLHYFAGGGSPTQNWHAVSVDGLQFRKLDDFFAFGLMMSNGIRMHSGYRFYGFPNKPPPEMNIQSIASSTGMSWILDSGVRLQRDASSTLEGMYVKDPAVIVRDSVVIMYYVTRKPEYSAVEPALVPLHYELSQNYPNPFNPVTTIRYQLPALRTRSTDAGPGVDGTGACFVYLSVYDILGREVTTLVREEQSAGRYSATWDASNMTSGVYLYTLQAGGFRETKRMLLLR